MLQPNSTIYLLFLFLAVFLPSLSLGLTVQPNQATTRALPRSALSVRSINFNRQSGFAVMMSADDNAEGGDPDPVSSSRRRRRKRKVQDDSAQAPVENDAPPEPAVELKPRNDTPVQLQVKDVRELVGGTVPSPEESSPMSSPAAGQAFEKRVDSAKAASASTPSSARSNVSSDDSLERLLEDARQMQEDQIGVSEEESSDSIKSKVRNVLSTIVTVDFFVVCAFLLWFLLGIFCSSVLKDDTVQILFNNNFETLVQPALGVLMIASIAGNFFKEDEEGMENY